MANKFYRNARIVDKIHYAIPRFVTVDFSDIPGKKFTIQEGDRLDIIAEQLYGDPTLFKAIMIYNDLGYFFDVTPGTVIKLPFDINKVLERI